MFTSTILEENNCELLVIKNDKIGLFASINLTQGASLQTYFLNNVPIIKPVANFTYAISYASAILFPFVSRTKSGMYEFDGKTYQLNCNTDDQKTALHGLLYNQTFKVLKINEDEEFCEVQLRYLHKKPSQGYPFLFSFTATYTFLRDELHVGFNVENIGDNKMPFTIGWHPYFYAPNFEKTNITFNSKKQVVYDDDLITKDIKDNPYPNQINFKDMKFDDCWLLTNNVVDFTTDVYQLKIASNLPENYLQIYTPPKLPLIAVEPMLGISNSLNNKVGLQILQPNKTFEVTWSVFIKLL